MTIINLIPKNYSILYEKSVLHDATKASLTRYKNMNENHSNSTEHFSILEDSLSKDLLGFVHLDERLVFDDAPSEEEAKEVALNFLKKYAPEYLKKVEVKWVKQLRKEPISPPHDVPFVFINKLGVEIKLIGTRVKLYDASSNKYGWVIVNKESNIINFERDIVWSTEHKCRSTPRWLLEA